MIHIKSANIDNLELLSILFNQYRIFYRMPSELERTRVFLSARIQNKDSEIFTAENNKSELMGFVQLYPIFSSTRMKRLWLLNDLFVDLPHRNKQISIQLISRCKQLCRDTDACGLILETEKTNVIGNALYLKTDFILDLEHNYYAWDIV